MTFTRAITHQKHLGQSGRGTRSAVDIFITLRVFTKEPIAEQEIKLGCLNLLHFPSKSKYKFINLIYTQQKYKIICLRGWYRMTGPTFDMNFINVTQDFSHSVIYDHGA